jgi:outer membrane immunogenic protein
VKEKMMRRIALSLLAATAIGLVTGQGASAADMGIPMKAPPVAPPVPLFNWTGIYAGGFFGMGLSRNQFTGANNVLSPTLNEGICEGTCSVAGQSGSHNGLGPLGGFTLGYRFQNAGSPLVWGLEGQFAFADLAGSHSNGASAFTEGFAGSVGEGLSQIHVVHNGSISSQVKDIATIAGTFGVTSGPQDRTLWFVKGGGAWAKTHFSSADNISASIQPAGAIVLGEGIGVNSSSFTSGDSSRWGWMVGTGVEWGLWGNWSAKIEYDFLDFGSRDVHLTGTENISLVNSCCNFSTPATQTVHVKQQIHMLQVGLNYKFDWGHW